MNAQPSKFQPGDHLRVHRGLYSHHGIYVGDGQVVDFGGGGLFRKAETGIRKITLEEFRGSGTVAKVEHPAHLWLGLGMGLPEPLLGGGVVHRAEWLLGQSSRVRYHLVGSNCEHIANWCVSGGYFESLQARKVLGVTGFIVGPGLILAYARAPWLRRHPKVFMLAGLAMMVGPALYNVVSYLFWKDLLDSYPGFPAAPPHAPSDGTECA